MSTAQMSTVAEVVRCLSRFRLIGRVEKDVQDTIERVLIRSGVEYRREYRIGRGPIDFYLPNPRIGIEVKTKGGQSEVLKQLLDYADDEAIAGIVLVTTKPTHGPLVTGPLRGKPAGLLAAWKGF